jgi:hypothetical protein
MKKTGKIKKQLEELNKLFGITENSEGRWDGSPEGLIVTTLEDALARKRRAEEERKKRFQERRRIAQEKALNTDNDS